MAALLSIIGRAILEYDTEAFKRVAFLFEQQGFSFMAQCGSSVSESGWVVEESGSTGGCMGFGKVWIY